MSNLKKLSEIWNEYIDQFKITTPEKYCQYDRQLVMDAQFHSLVIQDAKGNLIGIDLRTLVSQGEIPDYFVLNKEGQLVGFDIEKSNSPGFYPNEKFIDLFHDLLGAKEME